MKSETTQKSKTGTKKTYNKEYYQKNKERIALGRRSYYLKNKKAIIARISEINKAKQKLKLETTVNMCIECFQPFKPNKYVSQSYCSSKCRYKASWRRQKESEYYKSGRYTESHRKSAREYEKRKRAKQKLFKTTSAQ